MGERNRGSGGKKIGGQKCTRWEENSFSFATNLIIK